MIVHRKLVDFEIRGFQDELASFILEAVVSKNGPFSIANAKKYNEGTCYYNIYIVIVTYKLL